MISVQTKNDSRHLNSIPAGRGCLRSAHLERQVRQRNANDIYMTSIWGFVQFEHVKTLLQNFQTAHRDATYKFTNKYVSKPNPHLILILLFMEKRCCKRFRSFLLIVQNCNAKKVNLMALNSMKLIDK